MCVVYVCVRACMCECRYTCSQMSRSGVDPCNLPWSLYHLIFRDRVFHWTRSSEIGQTGWPVSSGDLLVPTPYPQPPTFQSSRLQIHVTRPALHARAPNSGPHVCTEGGLPPEPSLHPASSSPLHDINMSTFNGRHEQIATMAPCLMKHGYRANAEYHNSPQHT